jgi:hypothetical protein
MGTSREDQPRFWVSIPGPRPPSRRKLQRPEIDRHLASIDARIFGPSGPTDISAGGKPFRESRRVKGPPFLSFHRFSAARPVGGLKLTTLRSLRLPISLLLLLLLGILRPSPAGADHGTPGQSFTFLQAPFTQELFGTHADFADGVAFAPDGDVLIAFGRLARYDRQGVEPNTHGDGLHPITQLQDGGFNLGITNHPDGHLYANTGGGITRHDVETGTLLGVPFGPPGNGLGIAIDPKNNNIVYADGLGTVSFVDPGFTTSGVFSNVPGSYDGIFFDPTGDFLFLADFSVPGVTILRHDGTLVQHISFTTNCCPDGIAFRATAPRFVVTNNTDGTMTRLDFPGDDFTQPPTQTLFASGGFRGDLANVGPDGCLYLSQAGTRFQDGQTSGEGSIVRICPGFAPPISGRLEVKKSLSPPSDPGRFNLQIDGTTQLDNAGDGDSTGEIIVSAGPHTVGETGGSNPPTSLSDYTNSIVCKDQNGQGAIVAQGGGPGPLNVTVNQNDDIVCTITNTRTQTHTTLTKNADPTSGVAPLTVTYTYQETNDGSEPINGVAVTDDMCSPVTRGTDNPGDNDASLEPAETWTFTCTHTFTSGGTFTNTATATGTISTGTPAPPETATATVTVTEVHTTLTKTASPTSGVAPLAVTYSYQEANDGTEPLTNIVLTDDMCSPVVRGPDSPGNNDAILAPEETWTFTCTHTFTSAGTFTNTVVATGTMSTGAPAPEERVTATVAVTTTAVQALGPGYWNNHMAATTALLPQALGGFTVGDFATARAVFAAMNCSNSSTSTQNAVGCLAGHLLAAKLNVANGSSTCIAPIITAADTFLTSIGYTRPTGTFTLTADQRATAISLKSTLDAYNNTGTCT